MAPASTCPIYIASWPIVELLANSCTIQMTSNGSWRCVGGSQDPGPVLTARASRSLPPRSRPPETSSCGPSLSTMQWLVQGTWPVGPMPCRAASPGSNRCFNLCQALKPSSSLMLMTTFFDSPSVILRSRLQRLVCSSITLPYFVSSACQQRSSMTSSWSISAGTFFIPGVIVST